MTSQRPRRAFFKQDVTEAIWFAAILPTGSRAKEARLLLEEEGWPPALVVIAFALLPTSPLNALRGLMINKGRRFATDRARFNRHAKAQDRPTC